MQRRITTLLLALLLVLAAVPTLAQKVVKLDTLSHEVHFRWDRSKLDTTYMGNDRVFRQMAQQMDSIGVENIDSVVIVSQSSPEGPFSRNQGLSHRRAATMRSYMEQHHPEIKHRLTVMPDGESWQQLRRYVAGDSRLKDESKERVLRIIDDSSTPIEIKKRRLSKDAIYRYLYATYYPKIRNSQIQIVYRDYYYQHAPLIGSLPMLPARSMQPIDERIDVKPIHSPLMRDTLVIAAKTNLLYDAVTALNVEVELPIGNHWSVAVEDVFPWWEKDNKYCFQMWEMGAEARYWFRRNEHKTEKLRGHFVGAYAMSSKFDFQNDHDICYQGEYWSAGLTYGYTMKLTRHLNMEFSISLGWLSSAYRHYYPADDYGLLWRDNTKVGRIGYFGPTKLKVALVCPIRIPYKKKGGTL